MRYEYLISHNLALLDLPAKQIDRLKQKGHRQNQNKNQGYFHKIFRQLLIYDQLPDDNLQSVLRELLHTAESADPAYELLFQNQFEQFINSDRHRYVWQKIRKDYNAYIHSEKKRRNTENPYYNSAPDKIDSWEALPDFSRQKRNQSWQFDSLYRDSQNFAAEIHELGRTLEQPGENDKDLFRAKVNSIMVPEKVIFAFNSSEANLSFLENEMTLANIKLSLDAYKQSFTFLNRVVESLHKIRWSNADKAIQLDRAISFAGRLLEKIKPRIFEFEKRFMLFIQAIEQESRTEE